MKRFASLLLTLCVLFLLLGLLPVHGESQVYDKVLRIHVLANSDSEEDQAMKLQVRDAILQVTEPLLQEIHTREEAESVIRDHLPLLKETADRALESLGARHTATVELSQESYPTRIYEQCAFPAGSYLSLRIRIGSGEGQNWWCVLFPPMCLSAASKETAEDAFISVGFTDDQYRIITETNNPTYTVRFKILEVLKEQLHS